MQGSLRLGEVLSGSISAPPAQAPVNFLIQNREFDFNMLSFDVCSTSSLSRERGGGSSSGSRRQGLSNAAPPTASRGVRSIVQSALWSDRDDGPSSWTEPNAEESPHQAPYSVLPLPLLRAVSRLGEDAMRRFSPYRDSRSGTTTPSAFLFTNTNRGYIYRHLTAAEQQRGGKSISSSRAGGYSACIYRQRIRAT